MKNFTFILFSIFFSISISNISAQSIEKNLEIAMCCVGEDGGRCVGKSNCTACKNCSRCKHCKQNGGSCGVCAGRSYSKNSTTKKASPTKPTGLHFSDQKKSDTYLKIMYVTAQFCSLQSKPSNDASSKMNLNYGEEVIYLGKKGDWIKVKVKINSKIGYVKRKNVEFKR
ncbi:SH3 domain-containing protein [Aureivirga marina]|uniref:SH3 domain-containing protein n=1 Tax=Aureivirga marina TaxID=1182451 RepID=UPI0018CA3B4D|nr:SH3 domain-containing protein [Aureivirga marina]